MNKPLAIPKISAQIFRDGIRHPQLYLWDAWSYFDESGIHLYCLAVSREKDTGEPILLRERNNYQFHFRHFVSSDNGASWRDSGCFQKPAQAADGHDARNIWSGSVTPLSAELCVGEKKILVAYTGIRSGDDQHPFAQNLAAGLTCDGNSFDKNSGQLLLCPIRDEKLLRSAGYWFSRVADIGSANGEQGGPILAWRDPFCFNDANGELYVAWSAKASAKQCALGLARLCVGPDSKVSIEKICAPILMPDADEYTQFELPKIYYDSAAHRYLLVAATSNRKSESQDGDEIVKRIRIYYAKALTGPWIPGGKQSSIINGLEQLFGMTVLRANFDEQKLLCISAYTDGVAGDTEQNFAPAFEIDLNQLGRENAVAVKQ